MNPFDDTTFRETKKVSTTAGTNPFESERARSDDGEDSLHNDDPGGGYDMETDDDLHNTGPAEASWQYLGVLPYRRVPVYSNVHWDGGGLASYPAAALHNHQKFADPRALLKKTTTTKCVGCPNGGPIAVITLPLTASTNFPTTVLRIMTVSGQPLAKVDFPPPYLLDQQRRYTPFDVLQIGFTSRCVLVVVLKDSLCLTLDLQGEPILPPFALLNSTSNSTTGQQQSSGSSKSKAESVQLAEIYEGGVAVVAHNKEAAIAELLDRHDDPEYLQTVHPTAVQVHPVSNSSNKSETSAAAFYSQQQQYYAVVTPLPATAAYAITNLCHYTAVAVLPRTRTENRHPEVFLATSDHSVVTANVATGAVVDVNCRARLSAPIVDMCLAPNGRFLACFTENSMLTVISTNFETKVLDFDTSEGSNTKTPLALQWCGEDSVVLHWKNLGVLMVGPYGDWLRFPYNNSGGGNDPPPHHHPTDDDHLFLLPELDCCRVITDHSVEILQRVPPATALLLRIGSIETSAMLLDAADAYHSGSPASDEAARAILQTGQLEEAVQTCTDSATKEFDIGTQKRLLRAASYGMHFAYKSVVVTGSSSTSTSTTDHEDERTLLIGGPVSGSDPETGLLPTKTTVQFVDAARKLRILNALRNPDVGFLLTAAQFDAMTPTGVVARLIAMKRPELAVEIGKYLNLPKAVQLFARAAKAAAFVQGATDLSDSETAERAIRIIEDGEPPSLCRGGYATVAGTANKVNRPGVANLLLILESSVADKVPALISTGNYSDAMAVATSSR